MQAKRMKHIVDLLLGIGLLLLIRTIYDDNTKGAICGAIYDENQTDGCTIIIPVKRCRRFILEFSGRGFFLLKGLKLKFYQGSEI